MSDSGLLKATVDLPSVGQTFDTPKFYVDQAGHQAFDRDGGKIATSVLTDAQKELEKLIDVTGQTGNAVEEIKKDIEKQKDILDNASDADTTRSVTESSRHIRQAISKVKHAPENQSKVLTSDLEGLVGAFDEYARDYVDSRAMDIFDLNAKHATECLARSSEKDIKDAESHIRAMQTIFMKGLWTNPEFMVDQLRREAANSHLATDKKRFEDLIQKGVEAVEANDTDELRRILFALNDLKIRVGGSSQTSLDKLASIMRA